MKSFRNRQRVLVRAFGYDSTPLLPASAGTVVRLRMGDHGAWIQLDQRSEAPGAHPFPADDRDGRGCHVLAYPEDCDATDEGEDQ